MPSWWSGPPRPYEDSVDSFLLRVAFVAAILVLALLISYWHSNPTGCHTVVAASASVGGLLFRIIRQGQTLAMHHSRSHRFDHAVSSEEHWGWHLAASGYFILPQRQVAEGRRLFA
jgi:hypothetical protein